MPITLSLFSDPQDNRPSPQIAPSLAWLAAEHPHEPRASKVGALWSPARYLAGAPRGKSNVLDVSLLFFDVDDLKAITGRPTPVDAESLATLVEHVDAQGLERWIHSTHSHDPRRGAFKVRMVFALSRPVFAAEWPAFFAQAAEELCPVVDPSTCDASRIYYPPTCPEGTDPDDLIHDYRPGRPIDVDAMLERARKAPQRPRVKAPALVDVRPQEGAALEITDRMREASARRLASLCAKIRTFPQGSGIYAIVRDAAFEMGGRVAAGAIARATVEAELREAHRKRNPNPERVREKDELIEKALADGGSRPWCPSAWFDVSEQGLAEELIDHHGSGIRYVSTWEKWIGWDGTCWTFEASESAFSRALASLTSAMRLECEHANEAREKALRSGLRLLATASGRRNVQYLARMIEKARVHHDKLDADPWALTTPIGTIDLRTGHTHEHDPGNLGLRVTSVHPAVRPEHPRWSAFLRELTMGDAEVEAFLQRAIGYSLTGRVEPHALFVMQGSGGNGKGAFLRAIKHMMGTYAITAGQHLLIDKQGHAEHSTGIADLHRRRIATISEVEEGKGWDEVELKALVDSDDIRARRMREDSWQFKPTHHFWLSGNYMPTVRGVDNGVWRRLFVIQCSTDKLNESQDLELDRALEAEAPSILAWAIEGCLAWQRDRMHLKPPAACLAAKEKYRSDSDTVAQFFDERLEQGVGYEITSAQLFSLWVSWCTSSGAHPHNVTYLSRRLARYGSTAKGGNGVRKWVGFRQRTVTASASRGAN